MAEPAQPPPRPKRRWFRRILLTLLILTLLAGALVYWRLRAPLPDLDGTLAVEGLSAAVQIVRDVDNVPHIRADNEADGLFALGYLHAQERLWQMELQRRVAWGRLAEFAGPEAVDTDRLMRTIGLGRAGAETWRRLPPDTRASIEAYVAGINAFLATHRGGSLPVEFAILRLSPEPFRGEDVVAWHKTMGWLLSQNWRDELLAERVAAQVGDDATVLLMPAYTPKGPIILPPDASVPSPLPASPLPGVPAPASPLPPAAPAPGPAPVAPPARQAPVSRGDAVLASLSAAIERGLGAPYVPPMGGGSNNWVVAGTRTVTGRPLLANDPHLAGSMPGIWYLAHITAGKVDCIGATLPGLPGVLIGHNARIAWGITALLADVQDLYTERLSSADQAAFAGAWEPLRIIRDVITVRGAPEVPLRVRLTRHGPLVSDLTGDASAAMALRWTGHDPDEQSAGAILKVNAASSWAEFTAALSRAHVPALNFVYADIDGNIGYLGAGAFPVRTGSDGRRPAPGWTGDHEWRGYVHDSEWPRALNPGRGYLASANNQAVPDGAAFPLSTSWEAPYRAARIVELIEATSRHAVEDMGRIQRDVRSAQAVTVLPFLLTARPTDGEARAALERLRGWDGTMGADSPEAALFAAWYDETVRGMFEDDLGPQLFADYVRSPNLAAKALDHAIQNGETAWCDDVRTPGPETCATLLARTLDRALTHMGERQGSSDPGRWRWDRVNTAVFPHAVFDRVPLLQRFFSRRLPAGGHGFTVNPVMPLRDDIYISSYRQIIDLAALDASRFVIPGGQSGHVWSPQYDNLLPRWGQVEYLAMRFSREAVDAAQTHRLVLEPQ